MEKGVVTKKLANKFWVKTDKDIICLEARGNLKKDNIFVGDKVEFQNNCIEKVEERKNKLIRPPITNIDSLIIVIAPLPKPDYLCLDKMILFCKLNNIEPIICCNKQDLNGFNEVFEYTNKVYGKHYKVIKTSAKKNVNELIDVLQNKISGFAGQSAVGKSALIKKLLPNETVVSGEMSEKIGRGKNTTRHCELFTLNTRSFIVDTAGFSSLDERLLDIPYFELGYYYPDFLDYLEGCKYKSCEHYKESVNECSVKTAVKQGFLDRERYDRYILILKSLKELWVKTHG